MKPLPNNLYYIVNRTITQNNNRIRFFEIQVNLTQNRFNNYVETARHNNKMVERKISEFTSDLTLFGFLNETNQNCVVKFGQIPDVTNYKNRINSCANTADVAFKTLLKVSATNFANAKQYNNYIRTETQKCYTDNAQNNNVEKMTECINNVVSL